MSVVGKRHPNVLVLTVDALRYDRISAAGYSRATTPNLESLRSQSLWCTESISSASFSQASMLSMFTSSLPLSCGGYDHGAVNRPKSLFQVFTEAGYDTHCINTYPGVSRYTGFDGHMVNEEILFLLNSLPGRALTLFRNAIIFYRAGEIDEAEMLDSVSPVVGKTFTAIEDFCRERIARRAFDKTTYPSFQMVHAPYRYRRVLDIVARHRQAFEAAPVDYVNQYLTDDAKGWLEKDWRFSRPLLTSLQMGWELLMQGALGLIDDGAALLAKNRFKNVPDATEMVTHIEDLLETKSASDDKPFFIWTHFFDTHTPYCPGSDVWYRRANAYTSKVGYSDVDISTGLRGKPTTEKGWADWSALYDATIRYVDEEVGRLLKRLEELNLAGDTIVAICGDHGEELGEHGNISHHFLPYEHNQRIPLMFRVPGHAPGDVTGLTSLLDLAPTLAHFAGVPGDPDWAGKAVTDPIVDQREYQINECFYGGQCDFVRRPVYIGVRTKTHKYFWKPWRDPADSYSHEGPELYDLRDDPDEQRNIYSPDHPLVPGFQEIVSQRLAEIDAWHPSHEGGISDADLTMTSNP